MRIFEKVKLKDCALGHKGLCYDSAVLSSPGSIAFAIGPLTIHWYGIMIGIGILLCYWYVAFEVKRRQLAQKPVDDMALWVILSGIVGARLYYILFNLPYYTDHLVEILKIWRGGLAIHGALLGGAAAYFIYILRHNIPWKLYADIIMPGILLAQGIGRWGNFFNNEAFGTPTSLPWKLSIPEEFRPDGFEDFSYFHPTFLYESLWNFIGFIILFFLAHRLYGTHSNRAPGIIFCSYFIWYGVGRFFIEGLRTDSLYLGSLRIAQLVSLMFVVGGIFGLKFSRKKATLTA